MCSLRSKEALGSEFFRRKEEAWIFSTLGSEAPCNGYGSRLIQYFWILMFSLKRGLSFGYERGTTSRGDGW